MRLICAAEGTPSPILSWKHNNVDYPGGSGIIRSAFNFISLFTAHRSFNGRSRLVIRNARPKHDGTYMCVASNAAGENRAVAAVRVKGYYCLAVFTQVIGN